MAGSGAGSSNVPIVQGRPLRCRRAGAGALGYRHEKYLKIRAVLPKIAIYPFDRGDGMKGNDMKAAFLASALAGLTLSTVVFAGGFPLPPPSATTTGHDSKTQTRAYVGLNWTWGGGFTPALVLGATNTRVQSDGDTTGAKLAFQGEIGVGYNFIKSAPLLGVGVNAPYVSAGVDGYLNPGFVPYATLHSQGQYDKPRGKTTTFSCPSGYVLVGTSCRREDD
jgi:hypothetical protein